MRATLTTATGAVLILASAALVAQESLQERLQRATALQSQLAELHPQVVAKPDDRTILRTLLETGLQYYELISTRSRFPDSVRRDLLDLKVAMQDMFQRCAALAAAEARPVMPMKRDTVNPRTLIIREASPSDEPFLREMLYHSLYVPDGCHETKTLATFVASLDLSRQLPITRLHFAPDPPNHLSVNVFQQY